MLVRVMSNIIKFPIAAQNARGKGKKPDVEAIGAINTHLFVGPWEFTCQRCGTKTKFESHNMVFRSVEFYCASCGTMHRVTNPAFSSSTPPKK
jgi:late competence protein required for DNA uptake (superfamily II DNA/RNA helicase)